MLGAGLAYRIGGMIGQKLVDKVTASSREKETKWKLAESLYGKDVCEYLQIMKAEPDDLLTDKEKAAFEVVYLAGVQMDYDDRLLRSTSPEVFDALEAANKTLKWNDPDDKYKVKWRKRMRAKYPHRKFHFRGEGFNILDPNY